MAVVCAPSDYNLSEGCLKAIMDGETPVDPIIQIVESRQLPTANNGLRFRILLSDGRNIYSYAMLGSQMNQRMPEFPNFSVVKISKYVCNTTAQDSTKKILIILNLELIVNGEEIGQKLGNPIAFGAPAGNNQINGNAGQQATRPAQGFVPNNPVNPQQTFGAPAHYPAQTSQFGGGNQTSSFGGGNQFGGNNNTSFGGNNMKNQSNFGGGPPAKRANFGQNTFVQTNMQTPNGAQNTGIRYQAPTYPAASSPNGSQSFGGANSSFQCNQEGFGDGETPTYQPIESITPFRQGWTIRAKVVSKEAMREYCNQKGNGKLFNMWLADDTDRIKCKAFNETAGKFYDLMQKDKVYYLRNATLQNADPRYSGGKQYELTLRSDTLVKECLESLEAKVDVIQYKFTKIDALLDSLKGAIIDIIGICINVDEVKTLTSNSTGKEYTKREIELKDESNKSVRVTLWGNKANEFDMERNYNKVVAIKGCTVSDFGGKSLSTNFDCDIKVEPEINVPEAHMLKGWFMKEGENTMTESVSSSVGGSGPVANWSNFALVAEERMGSGVGEQNFIVKGTIMHIHNADRNPGGPIYRACKTAKCNKKMIDVEGGNYRCEACNSNTREFNWRLMPSLEIADFSGSAKFVSVFSNHAEVILGRKGEEMGRLFESDPTEFAKILKELQFKTFAFKMRAKMENYNDQNRMKYQVTYVEPIKFVERAKHYAQAFREMFPGQ